MELLNNKLIELNFINSEELLDIDKLKNILNSKFKDIDYKEAINDIKPFIKNIEELNIWNSDFFINITSNLY